MNLKEKFKSFFNTEDEYEYIEEVTVEEKDEIKPKNSAKNVVSLSKIQQPNQKVVLYEPKSYNEAQDIADNILNKRAVVINLQRVDHAQARRIIDFLSGTVYAVKGDIQKLGLATFLCVPENVDVTGTISQAMLEDELEKGW